MNFVTILLVAACLFQAVHSKPKHGKGKEPAVPSYHITTPKPKEVHEHFEQQVATCYQVGNKDMMDRRLLNGVYAIGIHATQ